MKVSDSKNNFQSPRKSRLKTIIGFLIAVVSVIGINFVPLEMWLDESFSGENLMIVYAIESLIALLIGIFFVFLFAPVRDDSSKLKTRKEVFKLYLTLGLGFTLAAGIFIAAFVFLVLKAKVDFQSIQTAILWIFGFQIVLFAADMSMLRPLNLLQAQLYLNRSLGRIFFLFLCVFIGLFVALFADKFFVLPFIILKTLIDIGETVQNFRATSKDEGKINPLTEKY